MIHSNKYKYSRDHLGGSKDSLFLVSSFINSNSRVLDVGCYQGALGKYLIDEKNCIVDGIEYNDEAAEFARQVYNKVLTADLNHSELPNGFLAAFYDYIVFADVLEHLVNPERALKNLLNLLGENGKVIISVPNVGYQGVLAGLADGDFSYRDTGILDKTHLRFFTRKTLKSFINSCGLMPTTIKNVTLPSADSEFYKHFSCENAAQRELLLQQFPDTNVYQFVALCEVANTHEKINEIQSSNSEQLYKATLYWKKSGAEYSDACSQVNYRPYLNEQTQFVFELDKNVRFDELRFDVCEEPMYCYIQSITIKSDTDEILFIQDLDNLEFCHKDMKAFRFVNGSVAITSEGCDPGLLIKVSNADVSLKDKNIRVIIEIGKLHSYSDVAKLLDDTYSSYNQLINSSSWKLTAPLRRGTLFASRLVQRTVQIINRIKNINYRYIIARLVSTIKDYGLTYTLKKIVAYIRRKPIYTEQEKYEQYIQKEEVTFAREVSNMLSSLANKEKPLISVLLPVYNSDKEFLAECIDSLISQSYANWELCICDDASAEAFLKPFLESYAQKDSRIKYVISEKNGHISKATNQALNLATGSHIVLLDHDDLLHKDALLYIANEIVNNPEIDFIYTDEDHVCAKGQRKIPFFKPDWSPALLYSQNYIGHIVCLSKNILEKVGGFTEGLEGAQDYDLVLKASTHFNSVVHIPRILYHWREHELSTAMNADSKPYAHDAGKKALQDHLSQKYPNNFSHIEDGDNLFTYKPRFKLSESTKASIIIPIRDKVELLQQLVISIEEKTTWSNYEIIIVDNGSIEADTVSYLENLKLNNKYKVIRDDSEFNWSRVNNLGVSIATGDVFVFLNNDTVVISEDWLESLMSWAQLPEVAVVGPRLLYEDGSLQHAGIVVGMGGWADHIFKAEQQIHKVGPFVSPVLNRNVLAVTGACQAIERTKYQQLGGFDELFEICGSDVELCIRAHKNGLQNVYLADSALYHLESKSRSSFVPENDFARSKLKYEPYRKEGVDPFFNPNLDIMNSTPTVKL